MCLINKKKSSKQIVASSRSAGSVRRNLQKKPGGSDCVDKTAMSARGASVCADL